MHRKILALSVRACLLPLVASVAVSGCSGTVDDAEAAEVAYLGLDQAVDRAIKLGFEGYNAANSANIPEQEDLGIGGGTMVVGGKVDQGNSDNKNMDLEVTLTSYTDGLVRGDFDIVYNGGPAILDLSLKGLPEAELTGTFQGSFLMDGDLAGAIELDLSITGMTQDSGGTIVRAPGTIRVTGSATSDYGVFPVDVSL